MLAAVVQLTSQASVGPNLARAAELIEQAAQAGAELVALPENFAYMRDEDALPPKVAQPLDGEVGQFLRDQAKRHGIVLAGGSFAEQIPGERRSYNTSLVIDADGSVRAVYRKIHLFDVSLPGATHEESRAIAPGSEIALAETSLGGGLGTLGLSICYDLRFPELYRELVARGARVLLVPSAFTVPTGRDHWEILLRARAIENQAFVLAAAQWGLHGKRRRTHGHSLIVDPWGTLLAEIPEGEGFAVADLDPSRLEEVRERLPALRHRRLS